MKTLIIGDIHGCWEEFQDLLDLAGIGDDDAIIAIGDVVDRGPGSVETLKFFHSTPNARSLMGNHERKHIRWQRGELRPALSQRITQRQFGEEGWVNACAIMQTFPLSIELPEALLVHGFFEPGLPLSEQRDTVLAGTMTGERYIEAQSNGEPWYTRYDQEKPLVVGHKNYTESKTPLVWNDRVYGLDTSCCHDGALTGLLLPAWTLISVPARGDHWSRLKAQHADLRYTHTPLEELDWEAVEALVSRAKHDTNPHPNALERIADLRALHQRAAQAIDTIYNTILRRTDTIVKALGPNHTPRRQGRLFAAQLGPTPMAPLYHLARQGKLEANNVRRYYNTPYSAVDALSTFDPEGET